MQALMAGLGPAVLSPHDPQPLRHKLLTWSSDMAAPAALFALLFVLATVIRDDSCVSFLWLI